MKHVNSYPRVFVLWFLLGLDERTYVPASSVLTSEEQDCLYGNGENHTLKKVHIYTESHF